MSNNSMPVKSRAVFNAVKNTILKHELISSGDSVIVALSGGADSVCLLSVLCGLREELSIDVAAAHLNHMIRGTEADRDEAYAAELCTRLGVKFYAERCDVPLLAESEGISSEEAGRRARYEFLKRIAKEHGYGKIATAHNRNDMAETVLMRVIRGTGIDGLRGIKYNRGDGVIRPLLDVMREDIEAYCAETDLKYCTDSTNLSSDYTRNRVRNELIPMLKENFNPRIIDTLCVLSDNAAEDADFMNSYAERLYKRINSPMPHRKPTVLDITSLNMVGESIQSRLIRIAAREVMDKDYKPERTHITAVRKLLDKETGASVELPGGLRVNVKYGWLEFVTADEEKKQRESAGFCYEIEIGSNLGDDAPDIRFEIKEGKIKPEKNQMVINYDLLDGRSLSVRSRRAGDRMIFFKDGRTRKLKDYWIDKKISRSERNKIPLLCADNEVIAIIGDRVAETYKMRDNSKRGLVVTYGADYENR